MNEAHGPSDAIALSENPETRVARESYVGLKPRRRTNMNVRTMKATGLSIALATAFLVIAGGLSVFAQDLRGSARGYDGRIYSSREQLEERKGFNDGLIAGRRDVLAHLSYKPTASIRYQLGGFYYRQGFQRGYAQAYGRIANNYENRNNDRYSRNDNYGRNLQGGYYDQWGNYRRY